MEMGIGTKDGWGEGGRQRKKSEDLGRWGSRGGDVYSRGREERENVGITRHVNETEQAKRAQENNQQSTMVNIKITQQLKSCLYDEVGGGNTDRMTKSRITGKTSHFKTFTGLFFFCRKEKKIT